MLREPRRHGTAPGYWQGKLDDVGVRARPLGIGEIQAIHNGGLNGQNLGQVDVTPPAGGVVITEFLASNAGGLQDEDLNAPDWIDLYNGTDVPVNLDRSVLTDHASDLSGNGDSLPQSSAPVNFSSSLPRRKIARSQAPN